MQLGIGVEEAPSDVHGGLVADSWVFGPFRLRGRHVELAAFAMLLPSLLRGALTL